MPPAIEPVRGDRRGPHRSARRAAGDGAYSTIAAQPRSPGPRGGRAASCEWLRAWARQEALRPLVSTLRQKARRIRRDELERAVEELKAAIHARARPLRRSIACTPAAARSSEAAHLPVGALEVRYLRARRRRRRGGAPALRARSRRRGVKPLRIGTRGAALALWQSRYVAGAGCRHSRPACRSSWSRSRRWAIGSPMCRCRTSRAPASSPRRSSRRWSPARSTSRCTATRTCRSTRRRGWWSPRCPQRGPVEDVLCARDGLTLVTLPAGARVGTCSARRTAQVRHDARRSRDRVRCAATFRPAWHASPVISTRSCWRALDWCGSSLDGAISEVFASEQMLPAPAQGAMAIQCRAADRDLILRLSALESRADAPRRRRRTGDAARARRRLLGAGRRAGQRRRRDAFT